jgi:hypothetical protein
MPEQVNIHPKQHPTYIYIYIYRERERERERENTSPSSVNAVECQPPAAIST